MIVKFARSLYRGKVDKGDLYEKLGVSAEEKLRPLIYILRWAGLIECEGNLLRLTKRGDALWKSHDQEDSNRPAHEDA
jgi:hypothetical protein